MPQGRRSKLPTQTSFLRVQGLPVRHWLSTNDTFMDVSGTPPVTPTSSYKIDRQGVCPPVLLLQHIPSAHYGVTPWPSQTPPHSTSQLLTEYPLTLGEDHTLSGWIWVSPTVPLWYYYTYVMSGETSYLRGKPVTEK